MIDHGGLYTHHGSIVAELSRADDLTLYHSHTRTNAIRIERADIDDLALVIEDVQQHRKPKLVVPGERWRDVCADMIREGHDREATALLVKESPTVVPYIMALEALVEAFAKLPALDGYAWLVTRPAGFVGTDDQDRIAAYKIATDAFRHIRDLQK